MCDVARCAAGGRDVGAAGRRDGGDMGAAGRGEWRKVVAVEGGEF